MNRKVLVGVIVAAVCFILIGVGMSFGPDMLAGFESTREATDSYQEKVNNVSTTESGANTTANVTLTYPVYGDATGRVTSITSNETLDGTCTANAVSTTALTVGGLTPLRTMDERDRTLTITYDYRLRGFYTALDTVIRFGPTMILLGFIVAVGVVGFLGIRALRRQ